MVRRVALPCAAADQQEYEFIDGKWVRVAAPAKGTAPGELSLIRQKVALGHGRRACRAAKRFLKRYPEAPACQQAPSLCGHPASARGPRLSEQRPPTCLPARGVGIASRMKNTPTGDRLRHPLG